jgi:signal transduction histidine kinase
MARLRSLFARLLGGRLQTVLILSFSLVAALTVVIGASATSRVIEDYLSSAESERVARDMELAQALYRLKLEEVAAISHRLVLDPWVIENAVPAAERVSDAVEVVDGQIENKITVLALGGTHLIALLDDHGDLVVGRVLSPDGTLSPLRMGGAWGDLPIVAAALESGQEQKGTEIVSAQYLQTVGLADQARVPLLETARAAPEPFDPREGSAGLALIGVSPLQDEDGRNHGAVLSAYLFNNDFTLVDRIKEVAGIDTVTIFLGDLRVSTNVMTGQGTRAVGTRISQEVYDVVLEQARDYVGQAFVVNDTYITRYAPLLDHLGGVVGSLYVGARESTFRSLVEAFTNRVAVIAVLTVVVAAVLAVPISHWIAGPITRLSDATQQLAQGDMSVHVVVPGTGELARLAGSFNQMVETLRRTQAELLHKQKLASMGQLAAGVAHEINNPLGTIHLYAGALRKELPPDDPHREDLAVILRETDRCKTIVADLLNFARQQEVLAQPTDIHDLLEQAIAAVRPHAPFEQVEIAGITPWACRRSKPIRRSSCRSSSIFSTTPPRPSKDRDDPADHPRRRIIGPGEYRRHRVRHPRGEPGTTLHSVLHDQRTGARHRPGIVDRLWHHQDAPRADHRAEPGGRGDDLHRHAAAAAAARGRRSERQRRDRVKRP